jgi:uncharacterized protein (DUF362 family)
MSSQKYQVRAVHCDHQADDDQVYEALLRATMPLENTWAKLKAAKTIGIKFNQAWEPDKILYHAGQMQELVSRRVARATLRLLRENTTADIICSEISVFKKDRDPEPGDNFPLLDILREFDVTFVDGNLAPHKVYKVPGGGQMFRQYLLPQRTADVDEFISVQKMKNHAFMGITLCLKNLFGLTPQEPAGHPRQYFHHLVRMPYMLADLGRLFNPALNIIDGLVAQAGREWGGEPFPANCLVAGDHVITTDVCGTYLMGHDPKENWPNQPFLRDGNALVAAAEGGFGTVNMDEIDFESEMAAPVGKFYTQSTDPFETTVSWRRTTCEQALYYRDNPSQFAQYAGEYILLQDGEVVWHSADPTINRSRRELSGRKKDSAMWLKFVDPDEAEGEHYEVYERTLEQLKAKGL